MNKWQIIHEYRRMTEDNLAEPLKCRCGAEQIVGLDPDDEPMLRCLSCKTNLTPGIQFWQELESAIRDRRSE